MRCIEAEQAAGLVTNPERVGHYDEPRSGRWFDQYRDMLLDRERVRDRTTWIPGIGAQHFYATIVITAGGA